MPDTDGKKRGEALPPPDASETAAIEAALKRVRAREPSVTVKFSQDEKGTVKLQGAEHNDHTGWLARLANAFGSRGTQFAISQLNQIMVASRDGDGKIDSGRVNAMLAMVEAARPDNELQAALSVQMAVTHFATLTLVNRAMRVDQIPQIDSAGNLAVKRGGEQVVKVVHVHPGGQAIVGNVTTGNTTTTGATGAGGGGSDENRNQPHAKAIAAAAEPAVLPPLWGEDAGREPVPVASGEG
jgi:hypothetical protein